MSNQHATSRPDEGRGSLSIVWFLGVVVVYLLVLQALPFLTASGLDFDYGEFPTRTVLTRQTLIPVAVLLTVITLARRRDVRGAVVVTLNYRLNAFGFLALLFGIADAFFYPAQSAIVPRLVTDEHHLDVRLELGECPGGKARAQGGPTGDVVKPAPGGSRSPT